MTNSQFLNVIRPDLIRAFGSGRVRNVILHLSPLGLIPRGANVTPSAMAWLFCALAFAPTVQTAKLTAWAKAKREEWGRGENPLLLLTSLFTHPHLADNVQGIVFNRTTGSASALCKDGSEVVTGGGAALPVGELVAVDGAFIAWIAKAVHLEQVAAEVGVQIPNMN